MRFVCLPLSSLAFAEPQVACRLTLPQGSSSPSRRVEPEVATGSPSAPPPAVTIAAEWSDTLPACFRSEAFAEDLDDAIGG